MVKFPHPRGLPQSLTSGFERVFVHMGNLEVGVEETLFIDASVLLGLGYHRSSSANSINNNT